MKSEIQTVVTLQGEFIGEVIDVTESTVTLKNPRMVMTNPINPNDDTIHFGDVFGHTAANTDVITLMNVSYVVPTDPDAAAKYTQAVTGLVSSPKPQLIL